MKKKLLALALALTMALSLAACGGGDSGSNADSTGETGTEENSGASGTAFKVGVIGPMTGGAAPSTAPAWPTPPRSPWMRSTPWAATSSLI